MRRGVHAVAYGSWATAPQGKVHAIGTCTPAWYPVAPSFIDCLVAWKTLPFLFDFKTREMQSEGRMCKVPKKGGVAWRRAGEGVCEAYDTSKCWVGEENAGLVAYRYAKGGSTDGANNCVIQSCRGWPEKGVGWRRGGSDRIVTSRRRFPLIGLGMCRGVKSGSETFEVGGPPALPPKRQRPLQVE